LEPASHRPDLPQQEEKKRGKKGALLAEAEIDHFLVLPFPFLSFLLLLLLELEGDEAPVSLPDLPC
jgi:hypothetical protein